MCEQRPRIPASFTGQTQGQPAKKRVLSVVAGPPKAEVTGSNPVGCANAKGLLHRRGPFALGYPRERTSVRCRSATLQQPLDRQVRQQPDPAPLEPARPRLLLVDDPAPVAPFDPVEPATLCQHDLVGGGR